MKYTKERKFVKEGMNFLKEEIIVSRIEILKVEKSDDKILAVQFKDRFGKLRIISKNDSGKFYLL